MPEQLLAHASAPLRVDCGGIVDVPLLATYFARERPVTVNVALDLRVHVRVFADAPGVVRVEDEAFAPGDAPLSGRFGTFFALCAHWGVDGVRLSIRSEGPPRSGLGGSSCAAVAAVAALDRVAPLRSSPLGPDGIARIAFEVERQLEPCGPQDHLAAAFGGASAWRWAAPEEPVPWERTPLPAPGALVVASTGESRASATMLHECLERFRAGRDRAAWRKVIGCARAFASALAERDWERAGRALAAEAEVFAVTWPQVYSSRARELVAAAAACGCGARFTGAGQGGCVWALGSPEGVSAVRSAWSELCAGWPGASVLPAAPCAEGVRVH